MDYQTITAAELQQMKRETAAANLMQIKLRESRLRKGNQQSIRDQAGGLFASERDQMSLF
jgi:hypothetical protein